MTTVSKKYTNDDLPFLLTTGLTTLLSGNKDNWFRIRF